MASVLTRADVPTDVYISMIVPLGQIELLHGALVCLLATAATWGVGPSVGASVMLGGALIWVSVWLFRQLFAHVIQPRPARRRLAIALLFAKLPLLWGLLWLITWARLVVLNGLGLAAGITCFPAAVVFALVWRREGEA